MVSFWCNGREDGGEAHRVCNHHGQYWSCVEIVVISPDKLCDDGHFEEEDNGIQYGLWRDISKRSISGKCGERESERAYNPAVNVGFICCVDGSFNFLSTPRAKCVKRRMTGRGRWW